MLKRLIIIFLGTIMSILKVDSQEKIVIPYLRIPTVDLNEEQYRQVVLDKEENQYLGHPTTVLLDDKKTILAVYPKGHGKGEIVLKKSTDGGLTWGDRIPVPESWKTSKETPTIHSVVDPEGKKRLILFSGLYPTRMSYSEDNGNSWSELEKVGDWGGVVVMSSLIKLNTGKGHYMALFHDDLRFMKEDGHNEYYEDRKINKTQPFTLYKTLSTDGGMSWSYPEAIYSSRQMSLCEPGIIRSPNGKQLAMLLRENSRQYNSQIMFSNDEGATWTEPRSLPNELTGDRHTLKYAHDGRILVVFRDITPLHLRKDLESLAKNVNFSEVAKQHNQGSPTEGDWVGWVGTWDDIVSGEPGQYRIRFKRNTRKWDCGYPGVELLPNKTFVVTSYGRWDNSDQQPYIMSVRFKLKETDNKFRLKPQKDESPKLLSPV